MSDPKPDNVVALADAFQKAKKRERKPRAPKEGGGDGGGKPPPTVPPRPGLPLFLPDNSPVKALGTLDGTYFYLDALGQLRRNKQSEHGRLHILDLFPWDYLCQTWPKFKETGGVWEKLQDFNHGYLAPVMMDSCKIKGVWDPSDRVRGCGTWMEDNGELVMHCGAHLWMSLPAEGSSTNPIIREDAGIRGDLLYPRRAPLADPLFDNLDQTGPRILDQLETWNFKRGELDQKIVLGWLVAALLGQAPVWRPMMWVTGGAGTGKSTLERLIEWVLGDRAAVKPAATSQAYVYQKIGDSALPVLLDEFESKGEDSRRQQEVIELMRIAASGGELGRGGSENNPRTYTLKSCFAAFSILIPSLTPQDRSRMAIVELRKLRRRDDEGDLPFASDDHDMALGSKSRWIKTGRELRGRVLQQWPRYRRTYHAYFQALQKTGLDARAASQFGALGAGQDLALYETLDPAHAAAWAKLLQDEGLNETKGYMSEPEGCLQHLLAAPLDAVRHGARETVANWLRRARTDTENGSLTNDSDDAARVLLNVGIRAYRDKERETLGSGGKMEPLWWIAVSSTHPALGEIFKGTQWKGKAGAPGTWAQALRGLHEGVAKAVQMRMGPGRPHWVTPLMWDVVFPAFNAHDDADEIAMVHDRDRNKAKGEAA